MSRGSGAEDRRKRRQDRAREFDKAKQKHGGNPKPASDGKQSGNRSGNGNGGQPRR